MASKKKTAAKISATDIELKYHLIDKYRSVVAKRYDYVVISETFELPDDIDQPIVENLKKYFLESLYPEPSLRKKLDDAFDELQNYMMHPRKVADLLGNFASAILRFGFQFPIAIKSALKALEVYSAAKHFENALLLGAQTNHFSVPLTDEQFCVCLRSIPKQQLQKFVEDIRELFQSFANTDLLKKTVGILDEVLMQMRSKQEVYTGNEIEAINLGRGIISRGYDLFVQLNEEQKQNILELVTANENEFLEQVYKK